MKHLPQKNSNTSLKKYSESEKLLKASIIPIFIASIPFVTSSIATITETFIAQPRQHRTDIILKILEKEKDLEVLNRVGFLIDSNLIKGKILKEKAISNLGVNLMKAAQYEAAGIISLINDDIQKSESYFDKSHKAHDGYHSSHEISYLLGIESISKEDKYCIISYQYTWGWPKDLVESLQENIPKNCQKNIDLVKLTTSLKDSKFISEDLYSKSEVKELDKNANKLLREIKKVQDSRI